MNTASTYDHDTATRLKAILEEVGLSVPDDLTLSKFARYLGLILRWNSRTNLTAIREAEGILRRHFVESIACAAVLPPGIGSLLDFGSGAGFPGIPITLCRPEIAVTLAESQNKKAAFLREVVRSLDLTCSVLHGRAEEIGREFDCVVLRAVDRMNRAIRLASELVKAGGILVVMTTRIELPEVLEGYGGEFEWEVPIAIVGSSQGVIARANRLFHVEHREH